jgi:rod shape-determining protein MreB|tara:strand:- start:29 stop:1039 length:1011 start_codon:yes stop_codon:yes gene_type:complete
VRAPDIAIDLGTANTLVWVKGEGVVIQEPSVVAVGTDSQGRRRVLSVGAQAYRMLGRTPSGITAMRPIQDGVIADDSLALELLKNLVGQIRRGLWIGRPRVAVCIPARISQLVERAMISTTKAAGAGSVYLIEEPLAAAIGAGLPVAMAGASMVVDIGGGTTDIAVITLGDVAVSTSLNYAGDAMDRALIEYVRSHHDLIIGPASAERLKMKVAWAIPDPPAGTLDVRGRCALTGIPRSATITSLEAAAALTPVVERICAAVAETLAETPPELSADLLDRGIVLAGGGSLLQGLDTALRERTDLPVFRAENPHTCVVEGAGRFIEVAEYLDRRAAL